METQLARLRLTAAVGAAIFVAATIGYRAFGQGWIDAAYQTMITVATVGFHENREFSQAERVFTMGVIVAGVGTMAYVFTLGVQVIVEGQLRQVVGRRRMDKQIEQMSGHVVICGWSHVGRAIADDLTSNGWEFVVVDDDADLITDLGVPTIVGDPSTTPVLRAAGVDRARALVAALGSDAENLLVTLTARDLSDDLFLVAQARLDETAGKLLRAGADRVVNPSALGAARMSSFIVQPNVAEFIELVMHERSLDLEIKEVPVPDESAFAGKPLYECGNIEDTGVVLLAIKDLDGSYVTNPDPEMTVEPGQFLIGIGTERQMIRLQATLLSGKLAL